MKRRNVLIAGSVAGLLLLGACGSDESATLVTSVPSSDASTVAPAANGAIGRALTIDGLHAAVDKTSSADSGRFEVSTAASEAAGGTAVAVSTTGEFDTGANRSHVSVNMAAAGAGAPATEVLTDGSDVYLRGSFLGEVAKGKWLKVPESASGALDGLGAVSGDKVLELLRRVDGEPVVDGTEDVRGIPTTRYRTTLTREQLASSDAMKAAGDAAAKGLEALADEIPVVVWIDNDGLLRKGTVTLGTTEQPDASTITVEMYDLGQPVTIEVPSGDQLLSPGELGPVMDALAKAFGSGN